MSGLDRLTREELIELVIELHRTVEHQAERITQLEDEIARLSGPKAKPEWVKPNATKKEKGPRKKRMQSYARQRVLAQRIDRFLGELFTFVQYPGVPSENNAAERAIRPAVIARKVSGGTRSSRGSDTQ